MDTKWLEGVCADPRYRAALSTPMTIVRDGKPFTVATDGHRIVEVPGNYGEFRGAVAEIKESLHKLLAPTHADAVPFSWSQLRDFIDLSMLKVKRECSTCDGEGEINVRRVTKVCPACYGTVAHPKTVYIGDSLFNARLFEALTKNLPDSGRTVWHQPARTLAATIDAGAWRVLIMPLREDLRLDGTRYPHADYPRFEIEGAQARAA